MWEGITQGESEKKYVVNNYTFYGGNHVIGGRGISDGDIERLRSARGGEEVNIRSDMHIP